MFEVKELNSDKLSLEQILPVTFDAGLKYIRMDEAKTLKLVPEKMAETFDYNLGSYKGTVNTSVIRTDSFNIKIENFCSLDGRVSGLRYGITNISGADMTLDRIAGKIDTSQLMTLLEANTIANLDLVKQARQKNDIPGSFNLAKDDANLKDAAFLSMNTEAGAGINFSETGNTSNCPEIYCEPVVHIKNTNHPDSPGILLGAFGQRKQLCDIIIQADKNKTGFEKFDIQLHFDNILLKSGASVESEWLIFMQEDDCWTAMDSYYGSFAEYFNIPAPPRPAPSLYCSWYFYGSSMTEADLDENLEYLKKNKLPVDVFLIDMGWFTDMGLWDTTKDWPSGMEKVAQKICDAGYEPGIWTSPFVVMADSPVLKEHPELAAKDFNGQRVKFAFRDAPAYAIDPTCPFAAQYLTELFARLKKWGYNYHKLDFLRSVEQDESIRFYDRTCTRAQAYVRGMTFIKDALGDDGYIIACGGLFEASAGLVHSVRSGSDVRGQWYDEGQSGPNFVNRVKQNIFRNFHNKLWHTDPDAMMLRLNDIPWKNAKEHHQFLSLGSLNDEEAFTTVVNQFLGDGVVCLSERLNTLQSERADMLKCILPPADSQTRPVDMNNAKCPSIYLSTVKPSCGSIGKSMILTVCNWEDVARETTVDLSQTQVFKDQAVFEFYQQKYYGTRTSKDSISVELPPHASRVFRITEIKDDKPLIIGTDLHLTSGIAEISEFDSEKGKITTKINSGWNCPVKVTALFNPITNPKIKDIAVNTNSSFEITLT